MGKLSRAAVAAGRGAVRLAAVRLLAGGRRDWAEAVWAEAHEVPPGIRRLAWRAGGVWLIAREALMLYRPGRAALWGSAAAGRSGPRPGGGGPPGPKPTPDPPGDQTKALQPV